MSWQEYAVIALEWALWICGLSLIVLPVAWAIFPKAIEALLAKARDAIRHAHEITLETHKGDVAVKSQISLKVYEQRRSASAAVRKALGEIEEAIRETYFAYNAVKHDSHPNDTENNMYREQHARASNNKALRLLREFRTLVKDHAGDLGETTAQMCEWVGVEQIKYLEPAGRGVFIYEPEYEKHRLSADTLREILATGDQADADRLQSKEPEPR